MIGIIEANEDVHKEFEQSKKAADGAHGDWHEEIVAYDDVSGAELDPQLVKEARKAEMRYFKKMQVYRKVETSKCWKMTGKKPIGVRWVDVNKQDNVNPKYRSRLVAKQFKTSNEPELYAATPPLEALKIIISRAATKDEKHRRLTRKIMVNDVSRAYFYARSDTPTFVEICAEDYEPGDEDRCGELNVSMYGTRQAAQNWQKCVSQTLTKNGFNQARSSPCLFWHPVKDITTMIHGDDFVSAGTSNSLKWLKCIVEAAFEISTRVVGPEEDDEKQLKVLNRIITYTDEGIEYEPDPRHAEIIVRDLGLENCNP
eukprot:8483342-Karenia_brevis.AAC.1